MTPLTSLTAQGPQAARDAPANLVVVTGLARRVRALWHVMGSSGDGLGRPSPLRLRGRPAFVEQQAGVRFRRTREHLPPSPELDGMNALLPGNVLTMCGISRGTSSGGRANMRK